MNTLKIPEVPNTANEPLMTIEQAVNALRAQVPAMPMLERGTLSKLGKDCSLAARAMRRPTGVVQVFGKSWPTEKAYTFDVLREAFRLHPATRDWLAQVKS